MGMEHHRVRIKDGQPIVGLSTYDGARLNLAPGEYKVQWLNRNRPGSNELEAALRFLGADHRGQRDIDVFRSEFVELMTFPHFPSSSRFEYLGPI